MYLVHVEDSRYQSYCDHVGLQTQETSLQNV